MISIDRNLCTGCGICLDACPTEAISLTDSVACIDSALCTSCGRCVDLCLTGAIIRGDDDSVRPPAGALAGYPEVRPSGARAPALPVVIDRSTVPVRAAVTQGAVTVIDESQTAPIVEAPATSMTRLEFAERALSGLFSLLAYALELKQRRAMTASAAAASTGRGLRTGSGQGARARARARSLAGGVGGNRVPRRMGGGQGARGGQRMGPGGGRGGRRGWNNGCGAP